MPGLTVNFMRYNNLPMPSGPLIEGVRMKTHAITANQYAITVQEQGFAVAVSELLLNASFDDIMASSSRLLGRNMALYMDCQARQTLSALHVGRVRLLEADRHQRRLRRLRGRHAGNRSRRRSPRPPALAPWTTTSG